MAQTETQIQPGAKQGALTGLRVVEMAGLGPCPLAGQMLADHGAEVIVIDRHAAPANPADVNRRGKRSIAVNLKTSEGRDVVRKLIDRADVLIEGFRPGVMERLGLGPEACAARNPRLIFGRMTGWGQDGPLSQSAGHDLNYLGLSGALHAMGRDGDPPMPPLNLVADYGGGTMFLLFGVFMALFERQRSGMGQVVDAAMVDGVPAMMGLIHQFLHEGAWTGARMANMLDGGAPYYACYETADGKYLSFGAIEPQFFATFLALAGFPEDEARALVEAQNDRAQWPTQRVLFAQLFRSRTRAEWMQVFEGSDACVGPVLEWSEVEAHSHNAARATFQRVHGVLQSAPAPRLTRTPAQPVAAPEGMGGATTDVLCDLGYSADQIRALGAQGVLPGIAPEMS